MAAGGKRLQKILIMGLPFPRDQSGFLIYFLSFYKAKNWSFNFFFSFFFLSIGPVDEYMLPFEEEIGQHPSLKTCRKL